MRQLSFKRVLPAFFPAAVVAVGWAAMALTRESAVIAAAWPVNALVLAMLIRWPDDRLQEAFVLVAAAASIMVANVIAGNSALMSLMLTSANMLEIGIAALVVRRFPDPTATLNAMAAFLGGAVLAAPAIAGLAAGLLLTLGGDVQTLVPTAYRWFVADALGMGIVGSFLLTIGRHPSVRFDTKTKVRFVLAQAIVAAASVYIFLVADAPPLFLIAPFLVAAAMSNSQFGGATALAIASVVSLVGAHLGGGTAALAQLVGLETQPVTRLLLAVMVFTVLPVSTLLRRMETYAIELEERRAAAEELTTIKTRLLAYVSHEIRSPLAGVTTLAELLRDGAFGELTSSQRETLSQIAVSGAQVTELARDLTDTAVLQSGKARVNLQPVRAGDAIASAVDTARYRAAGYGCVIQAVPGLADERIVAADPLRLRQILVNLMINGAKYGGAPPAVQVTSRLAPDGTVRFEVSDNGAGIDEERRAGLFQDFERLGAENSDLDGSGLGLALSRQIAQLQNGRLGIEDSELGGARFWLELPQWAKAADAAA